MLAVEKSDMAARTFYANFVDGERPESDWFDYLRLPLTSQLQSSVVVAPLRRVLDDSGALEKLQNQEIDLVAGGPPCQGFSLAGRRHPEDARNTLPWEFLEFVELTSPKMVVIENVVGMNHKFNNEKSSPFEQLKEALSQTGDGYTVQAVAVNAMHYGAPQSRPRLMLIALQTELAELIGLSVTPEVWKSQFKDEVVGIPVLAPRPTSYSNDLLTVLDAIGDLQDGFTEQKSPAASVFKENIKSKLVWGLSALSSQQNGVPANQSPRNHSEDTRTRFKIYQWLRGSNMPRRSLTLLAIDPDGSEKLIRESLQEESFPALAPDGSCLAHDADQMFDLMFRLRTRKHSQKALRWDEPAPTVVTMPDDYVHPSQPRIFTVREMARFQGFPDDFQFYGKETTGALRRRVEVPQYSQVGNAVSPFLAYAVGKRVDEVLRMLDEARDDEKHAAPNQA